MVAADEFDAVQDVEQRSATAAENSGRCGKSAELNFFAGLVCLSESVDECLCFVGVVADVAAAVFWEFGDEFFDAVGDYFCVVGV